MKKWITLVVALLVLGCGNYSVLVAASDSWGHQSSAPIAQHTGCSTSLIFQGAATTDVWMTTRWAEIETAVQNTGDPDRPLLFYMSLGWADIEILGRSEKETQQRIAALVNRIHQVRPDVAFVHAKYENSIFDTGFTNVCVPLSLLVRQDQYNCVDLQDVPVEFYENDPLHLTEESYVRRVEATWERSQIARAFSVCGQ